MHQLARYLVRWAESAPSVAAPANPELWLAVVIPSMDEPGILPLIEQLHEQSLKLGRQAVEILIVINHPDDAEARIVASNREIEGHCEDSRRAGPS